MEEKPKRRWRFSLRTLFVLLTLCAIAIGWGVWNYRQAIEQRKLLSGMADVGWAYEWTRQDRTSPRFVPKWIVSALGWDFFGNVIALDFTENSDTEPDEPPYHTDED